MSFVQKITSVNLKRYFTSRVKIVNIKNEISMEDGDTLNQRKIKDTFTIRNLPLRKLHENSIF